ncbi:hypothetical protein [Saccharothrix sp. NRRL B-16348]|nr:hypothetical protein [Saccharothrix sp. NRRL B-16348]
MPPPTPDLVVHDEASWHHLAVHSGDHALPSSRVGSVTRLAAASRDRAG